MLDEQVVGTTNVTGLSTYPSKLKMALTQIVFTIELNLSRDINQIEGLIPKNQGIWFAITVDVEKRLSTITLTRNIYVCRDVKVFFEYILKMYDYLYATVTNTQGKI